MGKSIQVLSKEIDRLQAELLRTKKERILVKLSTAKNKEGKSIELDEELTSEEIEILFSLIPKEHSIRLEDRVDTSQEQESNAIIMDVTISILRLGEEKFIVVGNFSGKYYPLYPEHRNNSSEIVEQVVEFLPQLDKVNLTNGKMYGYKYLRDLSEYNNIPIIDVESLLKDNQRQSKEENDVQDVSIVDLEIERLKLLVGLEDEGLKLLTDTQAKIQNALEGQEGGGKAQLYHTSIEIERLMDKIKGLKETIRMNELTEDEINPEETNTSEEEKMQQIRDKASEIKIRDKAGEIKNGYSCESLALVELIEKLGLKFDTIVKNYKELYGYTTNMFGNIVAKSACAEEEINAEGEEFIRKHLEELGLDYDSGSTLIAKMNSDQEKLSLYFQLHEIEYEDEFPEDIDPAGFDNIIVSLRDEELKIRAIEQMKKYYESEFGEDYTANERDESIAICASSLKNPSVMMKYYREVKDLKLKSDILVAVRRLPQYQRELTSEERKEVNKRIWEEVSAQQEANDGRKEDRGKIELSVLNGIRTLIGLKGEYRGLIAGKEEPENG